MNDRPDETRDPVDSVPCAAASSVNRGEREEATNRRVLLLSEWFPRNPETHINGVYRRLRFHVEAMQRFGKLDLAFFWPGGQPLAVDPNEGEEAFRAAWGFDGRIWFIPTGGARGFHVRDRVSDLLWAWRGAVSFGEKPTQRTSRSFQVDALVNILGIETYDFVFAHRLGPAATLIRLKGLSPRFLVDFDDLEHVKFSRGPPVRPTALGWAAKKWASILAIRAERIVADRASWSFVCSDLDRHRLQLLSPRARVAVIPNCADPDVALSSGVEPVAVFVGSAYRPNRDGIMWFVACVWPSVRLAMPQARLVIIGEATIGLGAEDRAQGISALGIQKSLVETYAKAAVALAPIHAGSGTRTKIIEAAMHAVPVVSTTIGAEGLLFQDGSEIVIADDPTTFAQACLRLLADVKIRREIGRAARDKALREYTPRAARQRLLSICAGMDDA
jgi:glycosyltransferase involved in cell wall biosynthesis